MGRGWRTGGELEATRRSEFDLDSFDASALSIHKLQSYYIMLGRLRDAVADVRDAGSNATRWLGIDEAAAYMGSGNERWRVVGARSAVAEEPELECNARAVECSISGAVRGHAALQALEQFAAARQASHARGEWSSAAAPLADAATARPRRWPLTPEEDRRLDETSAAVWKSTSARWRGVPEI